MKRCAGAVFLTAVACWFAGSGAPAAQARTAQSLGPIPATGFVQSRCAPMSFAPHVVHVGDEIVGSAGPAKDACGPGGVAGISWGWDFYAGLSVVHVCRPKASRCVYKATSPTGIPPRFVYGCINGNSGFGGWNSCSYYAVIGPNKRGLSGTVLDDQGNGVPRTVVSIRGPGGAQDAITDASGAYGTEVDPGNYSVSVLGRKAHVTRCTPGSGSGAGCALDLNNATGKRTSQPVVRHPALQLKLPLPAAPLAS